MDYKARFYSPYLNHFIQPDSIVPDPSNPQAWNRFGYVLNNPINFNDPTGHCTLGGHWMPDSSSACGWSSNNQGSLSGQGNGGFVNSGGSGNSDDEDEQEEVSQCSYHLCSDNVNLYELGWDNFGQAANIWANPNATYGQRWLAGAYMSYWGGAHICVILCSATAAIEYVVPGSITCMILVQCSDAVFWSGGKIAQSKAVEFANSTGGITLEQTVPGRLLNYVTSATRNTVPWEKMKPIWENLSQQFAAGASGQANVFVHYPNFNPQGVLVEIELNALGFNSAVSQINIYSIP